MKKKKDNEKLFPVPKDKKDNISSTTEIISSPSPILNNIKDEKIKIDIKSIPVTAIIDINKQPDIELFKNKNNFSLLNQNNPFIMKAKNVKIEQKFTVPQNSLFENYNKSKEIKVCFNNDNLNEKKDENNDKNKNIFNNQNHNSIFGGNISNNNISIFNNQGNTIFRSENNFLFGDLNKNNKNESLFDNNTNASISIFTNNKK